VRAFLPAPHSHARNYPGEKTVKIRALLALTMLCGLAASPAAADDHYPSRPVKILVPYVPGGATDIAARVVGEKLRQILGQAFVVENKPGAFGIIAIEEMTHAKPDGYTLMVGNPSTNAITPVLFAKRMTKDYEKSVVAVAPLVDLPSFLLVTTKDFAPKTVPELVAYAKAHPGKVRYGSAGVGSFPHYSMALFSQEAGIDTVHIPNKGGGAAFLKDIMIGDVQMGEMNVATAGPVLKTGTVRPIAVTEQKRLAAYPDIPSFGEYGYHHPAAGFWHAMFAPAATPKPVLEALHKAILQAMQDPEVIRVFDKSGMRRIPHQTLAEEQTWLAGEIASWRKLTKQIPVDLGN
jgi:tripartite-type tricarboxylate transporter receptor subunit TctC